jgi:molybdopterin synthase sulfur carrier subunit
MAKDLCQRESIDLDLAPDATIADLRRALASRIPPVSTLLGSSVFAVNTQYAEDEFPLTEGDEVACIPPVSGG